MRVSLDQILETTRGGLPALSARADTVSREAGAVPRPPSLAGALRRDTVAIIAEVKRRSPSAGVIREDLDPAVRAALYAERGAAAISVLTDGPFFGGSVADLRSAAARVAVPVLRKDFILDELQVLEARAAGAAAVLLIVRALPRERLEALLGAAARQDLDALVEVHTAAELDTGADRRRQQQRSRHLSDRHRGGLAPAPAGTRRHRGGRREWDGRAGRCHPGARPGRRRGPDRHGPVGRQRPGGAARPARRGAAPWPLRSRSAA